VRCESELEVNKHETVTCGECHIEGSGNTEPLPIYSGPLRMKWVVQFGLNCDENV